MNRYTYRAVSGVDVHDVFDGTVAELRRGFANSETPLASINGKPEDLSKFLAKKLALAEIDLCEASNRLRNLRQEIRKRNRRKG